jgi:hypothetical protein
METTQANTDTNTNTDKSEDCRQLKNIKFKNMLLASTAPVSKTVNSKKANIDLFLEKESNLNKHEPWNKLDKTDKIKQLTDYVDASAPTFALNQSEIQDCKTYLIESLDKKKLQHVKDVQYDNQSGKILTIPSLHFNTTSRKFTFKRNEKRASTSKSLGSGKKPVKKPMEATVAKASKVASETSVSETSVSETSVSETSVSETSLSKDT